VGAVGIRVIPWVITFTGMFEVCQHCVISGCRRDTDELCALLKYCAALSGIFVPTFRDNLSGSSSGVRKPPWKKYFDGLKLEVMCHYKFNENCVNVDT
jgi:hypothetical protein